jgi:hypothetical protein
MKKLLLFAIVFLSGCGTDNYKPGDYNTTHNHLPPDAVIMQLYNDNWARWELNGECFLSYSLGTHYGVLAKVDCEK